MPQKAHVTSVDALELFRSHLIVYLTQARPALEEVSADVVATRVWLESDRRTYWENQMRRRAKALEEAQSTLFSARLSNLCKETAAEQMAVHRAKRSLEEADAKLRLLKKWHREFDGRVQPLVKQIEKLHTVLANDMVKAVASLAQAINTLAAYAEAPASPAASASPPIPGSVTGAAQDPLANTSPAASGKVAA
jgi:hypothetical protein